MKIFSKVLEWRFLAGGVLGGVVLYFMPASWLFGEGPGLCLHRYMFGFGCPGCGMTRGFYLLIHAHFEEAVMMNPAILFLMPLSLTVIIKRKGKFLRRVYQGLSWGCLGALALVYGYRLGELF